VGLTEASDEDILTDVLAKLDGVRNQHGYWMARCPAHEDSTASLQVARGTEQPVVMVCMAGCDTQDVLAAVGLTLRDISSQDQPETADKNLWTPYGQATEAYSYADEDGVLLYQVMRVKATDGKKQFPVRVPDAAARSGWRWRMGDTRRVLYRLPRLRSAIESGEIIWVAEGEKDVHSLERAGVVATCNPGGAGKWRKEYSEVLRDAIVMIVADADKPGREHARTIAASLDGIAACSEICEAATGKDISDHLAGGHTLAEVEITKEAAADREPELAIDLLTFVAQPDPPDNWVIEDLLEHGDRLIWTGEEGLGKTTVTRQVAVAAAAGIHPFKLHKIPPQRVLFIDCENRVNRSRRKFRELVDVCGKKHFPIQAGMFRIVHRPGGINVLKADDAEFIYERVTAYRPDLLVVGPLYKMHAIDANEELAARALVHILDQALEICQSALIVEAHSPHGTPRSLRPRGSSLFMGWPDFGYGIYIPEPPKGEARNKRRVRVDAWRGPREDYGWPKELMWGGNPADFPWVDPTAEGRTLHQPHRKPEPPKTQLGGLDLSHPDP
jgi:5S rRNA maturation endonuclease (ribonuclease M5)